jgi:hypothetical protein
MFLTIYATNPGGANGNYTHHAGIPQSAADYPPGAAAAILASSAVFDGNR